MTTVASHDGEPSLTAGSAAGGDGLAAGVAQAMETCLRARAPGLHGSTPFVAQLAARLGRALGLDQQSVALIDIAVRIRDIGMIALPDSVVLATTPLAPAEWAVVNRHPVLGEQLIDQLPSLASAATIVRAHHERWDGAGYPDGLSGDAIPLLSRIIATCDAFVAIAKDRPHRRGMGAQAALVLVAKQSGAQFDPITVDALTASLAAAAGPRRPVGRDARRVPAGVDRVGARVPDLKRAIARFDVVPALAPAYERVLAAVALESTPGGEIVAAVEKDTGLTVAVLRQAQALASKRPITNVADAVTALTATGVGDAVRLLPRTDFPWRTSPLQTLMHQSLVHSQAVTRAADRIAQELSLAARDDILAVALLHDIGKLVAGRGLSEGPPLDDQTGTPEERVRREQRSWGLDHASLGGLLLSKWKLPQQLVDGVARHHIAEANEIATYVRLADMVAHHAYGDPADAAKMLELARVCGLSTTVLRNILFDLPYSGGSQRRRAERSPLSSRQTAVLSLLAQGNTYKAIALELEIRESTVRSHLHRMYELLGVVDRAQAVLRAVEMGWL